MESEFLLPDYVFKSFDLTFEKNIYPNIVQTKNITIEGLNILISKNKLIWSSSIYEKDHYDFKEGLIVWGINDVLIYFKKQEQDYVYKIFILTTNLDHLKMLILGLNKFFTIDGI